MSYKVHTLSLCTLAPKFLTFLKVTTEFLFSSALYGCCYYTQAQTYTNINTHAHIHIHKKTVKADTGTNRLTHRVTHILREKHVLALLDISSQKLSEFQRINNPLISLRLSFTVVYIAFVF